MLSKSHAKYIQSLHHKKFRDVENCFIAEGGKVIMELLTSKRFKCKEIYGKHEWLNGNEAVIRKNFQGPLETVEEHELEKISALTTANTALAVFEKAKPAENNPAGKISLLLDNIQDPGNMGTIIRIADWFGVEHIICSENTADIYNPKVVQSTMGSLGRVSVSYNDLKSWIGKYSNIQLYAAALDGKDVKEIKIKEGLLLIGNEGKGISDDLMQLANEKITIAKVGMAESLNAAVATGIILSHIIM